MTTHKPKDWKSTSPRINENGRRRCWPGRYVLSYCETGGSVLVIATPGADREWMLGWACTAGVDTYCVREDFSERGFWIDYADFDGIMLAHFSKDQTRLAGDVVKRAIDLVISAVFLALLAPRFRTDRRSGEVHFAGPGAVPAGSCGQGRASLSHVQISDNVSGRARSIRILPERETIRASRPPAGSYVAPASMNCRNW